MSVLHVKKKRPEGFREEVGEALQVGFVAHSTKRMVNS